MAVYFDTGSSTLSQQAMASIRQVAADYKAAGFVSYGGISGGLRSVQMTKGLLTTLKIVPIVEAVTIPFIGRMVENGVFKADEKHDSSAAAMLGKTPPFVRT